MERDGVEDQESMTLDDKEFAEGESDSEFDSSGSISKQFEAFARTGMIRLNEGDSYYGSIRKCFLTGMAAFDESTDVVAIHRNAFSGLTGQARYASFRIFSEAVARKCGGIANIKPAWYSGSRDEILRVVAHGFSHCKQQNGNELYGFGLYLSPGCQSIDGALASAEDGNGLRHLLLCHVILGRSEVVPAGSKQSQPSSNEYDSGIDNHVEPRRYIIWSSYMNSHVLPHYIVSFRAPPSLGFQRMYNGPRLRFPNLISMLANFLDPRKMTLLTQYYRDFLNDKITRRQLITKLRQLAGDKTLMAVIKFYKNKFFPSATEARGRASAAATPSQ